MYTAIKGIFENGRVTLQETPPTTQSAQVVVVFMEHTEEKLNGSKNYKPLVFGELAGTFTMSDDFNDPIDDFKDYM